MEVNEVIEFFISIELRNESLLLFQVCIHLLLIPTHCSLGEVYTTDLSFESKIDRCNLEERGFQNVVTFAVKLI